MTIDDWTVSPMWDALFLGGHRMPGVASVDVNMPSGVDVKKPTGARGARVRDTGAPPAKISIELTLLPADMRSFERYQPILRPRALDGVMAPVSIDHPNARMWGINAVVIAEIDSPQPTSGGWLRIRIKALECVDKPKAVKKPAASPKDDGWTEDKVRSMTDALAERPTASGAYEANFTSADQPVGNGFGPEFSQ